MNKRIILKTIIICVGVFLILSSFGVYYLFHNYEFEKEAKVEVLVASTDIEEGMVVNESMAALITIRESALNNYMVGDLKGVAGKKALKEIAQGDYITSYDLLPQDKWYKDEDKIIVIPMDLEARLANLIKKGSLVDIKVAYTDIKSVPQVVLPKVRIDDILDENGAATDDTIGGKKAYGKFVLNDLQRDKIYIASQLGKLIFELYCDSTQKPTQEEFQIPNEYLTTVGSKP